MAAGAVRAVLIAALVGVLGAAVLLGIRSASNGGKAPDYKGEGSGTVILHVADGDSLGDVGESLQEIGAVKSARAFTDAAMLNTSLAGIQPGYYQVRKEMRGSIAAARLADPEARVGFLQVIPGARLNDTTVVGGDTVKGIYSLIAEASCLEPDGVDDRRCLSVDEVRGAAEQTPLDQLGVPPWAADAVSHAPDPSRRLEGLLTAGNHDFDPTASPAEIWRELIGSSARAYEATGLEASAAQVRLAPYQLVTAASLIQHEAGAADYGKVATVILNRLHAPMRLQFDSTVNYTQTDQEVATTDAARGQATPWNTYAIDGLPYGPIASPSMEAITSMEHPEPGPWLYFVTVDDHGTTLFTENYDEHLDNQRSAVDSGVLRSGR